MNITLSPAKAHYIEQVSAGLADLSEEERDEVIQDLGTHLAELPDDEVVSVLGAPAEFVTEFRASAGLDKPGRLHGLVSRSRARLEIWSARLSRITRWPQWRHLWVWSRGWLVLSVFLAMGGGVAFYHFPIPAVGGRTSTGLIMVAAATWLSVWLDRQPNGRLRDMASVAYSALGIYALSAGILGGVALGYPAQFIQFESEGAMDGYPMTGHDGVAIENIFAYDRDGNPIEVILFDQLGRPLRTMPEWVYQEAEMRPGGEAEFPNGFVTFARDEFGRIIPNFYPLQLQTYNEWGELEPASPPGAWAIQEEETAEDQPPPSTARQRGE